MKRSRRSRFWHMGILILIYTCIQVYSENTIETQKPTTFPPEDEQDSSTTYVPISSSETETDIITKIVDTSTYKIYHAVPTWRPKRINCTPPAIEQFPKPLMGPFVRRHGGLIIHVLVTIFTFLGLAIVCNNYFVASLHRICEELKLSPDVAGATFMAAGSSAPELATVIMGVFFAKDDVGISGVIGSAVFNIVFVIAVCAFCTGAVCQLNWWTLVRDCFFYLLSILVMLIIIFNNAISWIESVIMLLFYVVYWITLFFNTPLERWALCLNHSNTSHAQSSQAVTSLSQEPQKEQQQRSAFQSHTDPEANWNPNAASQTNNEDCDTNALYQEQGQQGYNAGSDDQTEQKTAQEDTTASKPEVGEVPTQSDNYKPKTQEPKNPLARPVDGGVLAQFSWGVVYPIHYMCRLTMPDCETERYRNWYPFTFLMSMIWISFYSYFMVWMITIIGSTLYIPDTVMGLTFVAAGLSVPDALNSIAAIKDGYRDMAVSNAIGSNVFDILVCLGLPWFIQTAIIVPGSHVNVISKGLVYSILSFLSSVVFLLISTHLNGWKLDRRLGIILMVWYLSFIILASLYELNVFGELNPPECLSMF